MVVASVLLARGGAVGANVLIRRYISALVLIAVGMSGSAIVGSIPSAALTFAATGVGNALMFVSQTQLILLLVPSAVQGRLFGGRDAVNASALLLGLVFAGALVAGVGALRRAGRTAIVMPGMFALGDKVIGNPIVATSSRSARSRCCCWSTSAARSRSGARPGALGVACAC
jgi:hypothetical protein